MTALIRMKNAIATRSEKGAVSIEYLAIALAVAAVLGVVVGAASGLDLGSKFQEAVNKIFEA